MLQNKFLLKMGYGKNNSKLKNSLFQPIIENDKENQLSEK